MLNVQNLSTPFSPSNGIDIPSSSARGRVLSPPPSRVLNASSFHSPAHAHALAMIPAPLCIPALDKDNHHDGRPLITPYPLPHQLADPPQADPLDVPPHANPTPGPATALDPSKEAANEDAGVFAADYSAFFPVDGEGEPLIEVPIRPGRSFCDKQCMWVAQSWYRATEDSLRGANMNAATFQGKIAEYYNAFRLEFIVASLELGLLLDRATADAMYKERLAKFIYNKWNYLQRGVLEFAAYIKTRGHKPSGYASKEEWHKMLWTTFVDMKNARFRAAGKREKLTLPGLVDLYYFLM